MFYHAFIKISSPEFCLWFSAACLLTSCCPILAPCKQKIPDFYHANQPVISSSLFMHGGIFSGFSFRAKNELLELKIFFLQLQSDSCFL